MKKQTALEFLIEQWPILESQLPPQLIKQAKAMEKEQIVDAWCNGFDEHKQKTITFVLNPTTSSPLDFYNKTYGGDK